MSCKPQVSVSVYVHHEQTVFEKRNGVCVCVCVCVGVLGGVCREIKPELTEIGHNDQFCGKCNYTNLCIMPGKGEIQSE